VFSYEIEYLLEENMDLVKIIQKVLVVIPLSIWLISYAGICQETVPIKHDQISKNIPANLQECFAQLDKMLSDKEKREFKSCKDQDELIIKYHLGLGMKLRNSWGLWSSSKLGDYFREMGLCHPDDMSSVILKSYWCMLNEKPYDIEKDVSYYQQYMLSWILKLQPEKMICPKCGRSLINMGELSRGSVRRKNGSITVFQVLCCGHDHQTMFNGHEFKVLKGKYKKAFEDRFRTSPVLESKPKRQK